VYFFTTSASQVRSISLPFTSRKILRIQQKHNNSGIERDRSWYLIHIVAFFTAAQTILSRLVCCDLLSLSLFARPIHVVAVCSKLMRIIRVGSTVPAMRYVVPAGLAEVVVKNYSGEVWRRLKNIHQMILVSLNLWPSETTCDSRNDIIFILPTALFN
jgi:hypothetical protein